MSTLQPPHSCFPAGIIDHTPLEQLELRDSIIAYREQQIESLKKLVRQYQELAEDADIDLRQGTPTQQYYWRKKAQSLDMSAKELL